MRPRLRAVLPTPGRRIRRSLGRWALALGLAIAVPARAEAAADPCCALDWRFPDGAPPPFSQQELEAAVAIRQPQDVGSAAADPVALGWAGDGIIQATTRLRRRVVALGPARGSEAARLVALAVVDVLRPLALPAAPDAADAAAASGSGTAELQARRPPLAAHESATVTLALAGAVNRGATSAGFALEPALAAAWRLAGGTTGWQGGLLAEVGYGQARGRADTETLVLHLVPLRLGLFGRRGPWTFAATALARGYQTRAFASGVGESALVGPLARPGSPQVQGWLLGGHAGAQRAFDLGRKFGLLVAAGVDLAANAVDFRVRGQSLLHTGRVIPQVRMGLFWRAL